MPYLVNPDSVTVKQSPVIWGVLTQINQMFLEQFLLKLLYPFRTLKFNIFCHNLRTLGCSTIP